MSSDPGPEPDTTSLVSELVSSLQSAFRLVDFERVAKLIASREENLRRRLKEKEKRIELLETERVERIQEVGDLRAKVEGYAKRIEELLRNEVEVKARNRELEVEKLKAEKEVEVYRSRFSVLEIQLEKLERGFESVCSVVDVKGGRRRGVDVKLEPEENVGEMRISGEGNVGSGMGMSKAGDKDAGVGLDGRLGNSNCKANGGGTSMKNGAAGEMRSGGEGNVDLHGVLGNSNFNANGSGFSMRNGDCGRSLPKTIVDIIDSDEESTPTPRVAAEEVVNGVFKRKHSLSSDIGGSNNCNNHINDETNQGREKLMKVDCHATTTTKNIGGGMTQFASRLDVECVSDDTSSSSSRFNDLTFMPISSLDYKPISGCKRKWEYDQDMIVALLKDGMLCLKAICVLYRYQALKEIDKIDASRIETLANFLIGGDPQQKLTKTVKDLQNYDPNGLNDCRRLAIKNSLQLFRLYKRNGDSLFWS